MCAVSSAAVCAHRNRHSSTRPTDLYRGLSTDLEHTNTNPMKRVYVIILCSEVSIHTHVYTNTGTRCKFGTRPNVRVFAPKDAEKARGRAHACTRSPFPSAAGPLAEKTVWPLKPFHLRLNEKSETSCVAQKWLHSDAESRMRAPERSPSDEQRRCGGLQVTNL